MSLSLHGAPPTDSPPDPYRIFFPLGVILGLVGVAIWPAYALGWIQTMETLWHIDLQLHGFLFAFILGFLLTALPRFSLTWHATKAELIWFVSVFLLGNMATAFRYYLAGRVMFLMIIASLFVFAGRRFVRRKSEPPKEFMFVAAGLLMGLVAAVFRVLALGVEGLATLEVPGRRLFTEGMVLLLVLGIGGKLAPMFWGHATMPVLAQMQEKVRKFTAVHAWYAALIMAIFGSFAVEGFVSADGGLRIRALATAIVFFVVMGIHKRPKTKGVLVYALWLSAWWVALSFWGAALHPKYRVETLHVMFIGGFGTMILCIATRVTLSHGNYATEEERRSLPLAAGAVLLLVAMVLRSVAVLFPDQYFALLGIAGACWWAGLLIWGVVFSKKAIVIRKLQAA